jgi:hypothetical protein
LYNLNEDWNETNDLAAKHPQKLEELKKLFDEEAKKYNVYPLKNYQEGIRRTPPKQKHVIYEGTTRKTRVTIGAGDVSITANIQLQQEQSNGVIFSFGGLTRGIVLYIEKNQLVYLSNNGYEEQSINAGAITKGDHVVKVLYKGNAVIILVDGKEVVNKAFASGGRTLTQLGYDGISVGQDLTSPVTKKYAAPFALNGVVRSVVIEHGDLIK